MKKRFLIAATVLMVSSLVRAAPIVLDTFDAGNTQNALGGATGTWFDPDDRSIYCKSDYDATTYFGPGGRSLRLDYQIASQRENVTVPTNYSQTFPATQSNQAFNGYYMAFPPQNLTDYTHLIFWAKGDPDKGFTRSFKIELKDGQNTVYTGYRVTGLTDQWQRYAVPLRVFRDIKRWDHINEFVIVFAANTVSRKDGTIYVDDLYFAESADQNLHVPLESGVASRVQEPLQIDGVIKDWKRKAWRDFSDSRYVESGARSGVKDAGAQWMARWDDQFFYVAVAVKDNEQVNRELGDTLWKDDCVEIYISPQGPEFTWGDPAVFQLGFSPTSSAGNPARWAWFQKRAPTSKEAQVRWSEKRDLVEVAIAWSFLGVSPGLNRELGFAVAFNDRDLNDGTPQCKLTWSFGKVGTAKVRVGTLALR